MLLQLLSSIAFAVDVHDATEIYAWQGYVCAKRTSGKDVCWQGAHPAVSKAALPDSPPDLRLPFDHRIELEPNLCELRAGDIQCATTFDRKHQPSWPSALDAAIDASLPQQGHTPGRYGSYRDVEGQVFHWNVDRAEKLTIPPLKASHHSLVQSFYYGCALAPEGRVACWGDNDSGDVSDNPEEPLFWVPRRWGDALTPPSCTLHNQEFHCEGKRAGTLKNPNPEQKVLGIHTAKGRISAAILLANGQVLGANGKGWTPLFEEPGATAIWQTPRMICARTSDGLACRRTSRDGYRMNVTFEGTIEAVGNKLCVEELCLDHEPGEGRWTPYWVQKGW